MRSKTPSGRPEPGEYSDAHLEDVARLPGDDVVCVRGLGFQLAAHETHHVQVLRERYLPLLAGGGPAGD